MCNALSPEKAVIWSVLHGASTDRLKTGTFRYAPYQTLFDVAQALKDRGQAFSLDNFKTELASKNITMPRKELRALARMLKVAPPPRIRDNAESFITALADIQSGQPVHLHRFIN